MKKNCFSANILLLALACSFLAVSATNSAAAPDDRTSSALVTAKVWVAQIDAGQYQQSYESSSTAMQDRTKEDTWTLVLKAMRAPWGPVVSRKEAKHEFKPDGFEGTPGEYMVITYDTDFKNRTGITEIVVLKWENGKWVGAGYNAARKPAEGSGDNSTPPPQTDVHTEPHFTPQPHDGQ